jgi:hypothetical protein
MRMFTIALVVLISIASIQPASAQAQIPDPCVREYALGLWRKGEARMTRLERETSRRAGTNVSGDPRRRPAAASLQNTKDFKSVLREAERACGRR